MEILELVLLLVRRNLFFVSIDFKDVYLLVFVNKNYRKYLKFIWNGILYYCNVLIFGLVLVFRVFKKIMKFVFVYFR